MAVLTQHEEGVLWSSIKSRLTMNHSLMRKIVEADRYKDAAMFEDELSRLIADYVLEQITEHATPKPPAGEA